VLYDYNDQQGHRALVVVTPLLICNVLAVLKITLNLQENQRTN
jgi:hypothetical protein